MQNKSKLKILNFLSLILLTSCETKVIHYVASDCLVIPPIQTTKQDKETLIKYHDEFSYEFIKSLADQNEIRKKECAQLQ